MSSSDVRLVGVLLERDLRIAASPEPPIAQPKTRIIPSPVDTVHLNPAALAHLQGGGDADDDGDSK